MIVVKLGFEELQRAARVGADRDTYNIFAERENRYGHQGLGWDHHIEGAIGEYAGHKALNDGPWEPSTTELDTAGDIGEGRQVRSTTLQYGCLLVHEWDADDHMFVLAITSDLPTVRLPGWFWGEEAKRPQFWREPQRDRPCFMVPQNRLHRFPNQLVPVLAASALATS